MRAKQSELLTTTHGKSAASILARTNIYCQATRKQTPDHRRQCPVRAIASERIRADSRRAPSCCKPIIACGLSLQLSRLASVEDLACVKSRRLSRSIREVS